MVCIRLYVGINWPFSTINRTTEYGTGVTDRFPYESELEQIFRDGWEIRIAGSSGDSEQRGRQERKYGRDSQI